MDNQIPFLSAPMITTPPAKPQHPKTPRKKTQNGIFTYIFPYDKNKLNA